MFTCVKMALLVFSLGALPVIQDNHAGLDEGDSTGVLVAKRVKKVRLNVDNQNLVKVVKKISKLTGKNFIVENSVRNERLTIISSSPVTVDEAYEGFVNALHAQKLKVVQMGKFYKICRDRGFLRVERETRDSALSSDAITKVNDSTWRISRSDLDLVLAEPSLLAVQARIVPNFVDGKPQGFKLFSIRPGSLYQLLGFKNGDVVKSINGMEINSPQKAMEVYNKLKTANKIVVNLSRRGEEKTFTYNIK